MTLVNSHERRKKRERTNVPLPANSPPEVGDVGAALVGAGTGAAFVGTGAGGEESAVVEVMMVEEA